MATQFPSTVAGAIRVNIAPASAPRTDEYISESGTEPAVIPPLVIGMPIYRIPSKKLLPINIPSTPDSVTPTAKSDDRRRKKLNRSPDQQIPVNIEQAACYQSGNIKHQESLLVDKIIYDCMCLFRYQTGRLNNRRAQNTG